MKSAEEFHRAAGEPKLVKWYDTDHFLSPEAMRDGVEWLAGQGPAWPQRGGVAQPLSDCLGVEV